MNYRKKKEKSIEQQTGVVEIFRNYKTRMYNAIHDDVYAASAGLRRPPHVAQIKIIYYIIVQMFEKKIHMKRRHMANTFYSSIIIGRQKQKKKVIYIYYIGTHK